MSANPTPARWTIEQIDKSARIEFMTKEEAEPLEAELLAELGEDGSEALAISPEVDYRIRQIELEMEVRAQTAKVAERETKRAKRKGKPFKRARRVARSPETWRHLKNYTGYEISSHGRVRSLDRARPDDWLKPRRKWFKGMSVEWVVLYDSEGKRRERMVGYLLIDAGFLLRPTWMKG